MISTRSTGAVEGAGVQAQHVARNVLEGDAAEARVKAREVAREHVVGDADRLEELGADVTRDGAHAHLRHDLDDALVERLAVLIARLEGAQLVQLARRRQRVDRLIRQVGTDRRRAEAEQERHVMDLAHVAGFDDQRRAGAQMLVDQTVVDGGARGAGSGWRRAWPRCCDHSEMTMLAPSRTLVRRPRRTRRRWRRPGARRRCRRRGRRKSPSTTTVREARRTLGLLVDVADLREFVDAQTGEGSTIWWQCSRALGEQVLFATDGDARRGDELFADGVERRVRDLGEELGEVVEERTAAASRAPARVESEPIEPMGSSLTWAMWRTMRRRSSSL